MSTLLCIETSGPVCSIAWFENGALLYKDEKHEKNSHSKYLSVMIEKCFEYFGASARTKLDAIGLSLGPGSYTGLRIGTSVAKGLALALDIPIVGMLSTDVLVQGYVSEYQDFKGLLVPMIDARRMEVYTSVYDQAGSVKMELQPLILDESSYAEFDGSTPVVFIGDGAEKFESVCTIENASFDSTPYLLARYMGKKATELYNRKEFLDTAYFEPTYLKEFMALKSRKKLF